MAVTILERPEGAILGSAQSGALTDFAGSAVITSVGHGLLEDDIVYVQSNVYEYNGFFYTSFSSANQFLLKEYPTGSAVAYIADATLTFYKSTYTHGWSCVHLPITYRLSTNLYPTNSADTTRNINSVQEANGYTVLQLSGSLGSGVNTYDFVKIDLPADTDLSGVYQILEFISPTVMIINLAYDSGNNFTSATALKHYNNYNILVRVYAGINASHQWAAQKPYELAATLQFIPDEDNQVFFSINEILKSYIETRNNLVLGTLPNNIDFWINFYIEVAESYDDSDGYSPGTNTGNYTSDQSTFEGTAVNAQLEFKNLQSGYLSDYLMTNNTAKFLTLFTIPVLFQCGDDTPNCYSDISYLNPDILTARIATIRKEYYLNGNGPVTVNTSVSEEAGVIRIELEADCDYDRVDITLLGGVQIIDEPEFDATGDWLQTATAASNWTISGGLAQVPLGGINSTNSETLYQEGDTHAAGNYRVIAYLTTIDGGAPDDDWAATVDLGFASGGIGGTPVDSETLGVLTGVAVGNNPTITYDAIINISGSFDTAAVQVSLSLPVVDSVAVQLRYLFIYPVGDEVSETKQFKIVCGCVNQEIRLTWLNNLGGFDYWAFTAEKDHIREIQEVMTTKKNILPTWPKSYGADADTIRKQTKRVSNKAYTVRSQFLTSDEADALSYIKSSILVQIINSQTDRRTVIVDSDSFIVRKDGDYTFEIAFNISFTDDIPVQTA